MPRRTWFITGINRGLGRALAELLLDRGDRVAGTARRPAELDDLKARHGDRLWTAALDLTESAAIRPVVDRAFADLGRIDAVVNNAAYTIIGTIEECPEAMIRPMMEANVFGSMFVVQAALPHLRAQGGGRVMQIGSGLGQFAVPGIGYYVTSKWAVEGFIESLALEVGPFGIEATIFEPGTIRTEFGLSAPTAPALDAYAGTPGHHIRDMVTRARATPDFESPSLGDPAKMARVIADSLDQSPAPRRVVMGSDMYQVLGATWRERAESLEAQKAVALSTDA